MQEKLNFLIKMCYLLKAKKEVCRLSKKNKDTEVKVEEILNEKNPTHRLYVGKKMIGEVQQLSSGKFSVVMADSLPQQVKSFEEGYELLIRDWNLNQQ